MKMTEDQSNFLDYFVNRYTGHLCALFSEWEAPKALDLSNWRLIAKNSNGLWFCFSPISWNLVCRPDGSIELIDDLGLLKVYLTPKQTKKYRSTFPKPFNDNKELNWFKSLSVEEQKNVKTMYEQIDQIYNNFMKGIQDGERG
ncbi:hypothetical protein QP423_05645 [Lactobacillus jensenii]|nr:MULTISPECIES: hypothetical protein [Lactobacillus]EEX26684.1 hypothetical protein HMPREF0527_01523 [Lactobacillus jensenii SJ-7A-US]MBS5831785.1 hypothetical protein [Lactobacillus jensenii]MCW8071618.1 hypothetical protein [Lactobacillus jensenii]MCW8081998.1 hypothetical protein [Lactobacillus jensenii]MCZ3690865.1 hypothetical protein [Lactobacillus mulieris]